jgi:uncharacterized protein (DUF4213/DUF364 family)
MWELYDELLSGLPESMAVDEVFCGCHWTMVRSGTQVGVAMTMQETSRPPIGKEPYAGMSLREAAAGIKSWNLMEASVGLAAINAYYNTAEKVPAGQIHNPEEIGYLREKDAFVACRREFEGKNVCVVGHFPNLERDVAPFCNLSVLERNPQPGDYPDPACEYILSKQDFVFITGCTLTNKTFPRLLELSAGAHVVLVGPSVTLSPILFHYGADNLSGFIVTQPERCMRAVGSGDRTPVFSCGEMVRISKQNEEGEKD